MSAFECNITPTRLKNARKRTEDREPTIVDLRPFTGKAIVTFEDVPISKTARRIITILNPFSETITISLIKKPKSDLNLTFEWLTEEIPPDSKKDLEVIWSPLEAVSCRETIELCDHFGNRKNVIIILKSCSLKKSNVKRPAVNFNKKLKLKAPSPPGFKSQVKRTVICEYSENFTVNTDFLPTPALSPLKKAPTTLTKSPLRNATNFNLNECNGEKYQTPPNASAIFDNIKFTPLTETKPKCESKLDYLTSLPTPIAIKRDDILVTESVTRKNLMDIAISPDVCVERKQFATLTERDHIINNLQKPIIVIIEEENPSEVKCTNAVEDNIMSKTHIIEKTPEKILPPVVEKKLETTFKINKSGLYDDNIDLDREKSIRKLSESMCVTKASNIESDKLKSNQGSMPNLYDAVIKPIEHNRYYQSSELEIRCQNLSMESVISNTDFREMEGCAQSSRFNLNEIGAPSDSSSPVLVPGEDLQFNFDNFSNSPEERKQGNLKKEKQSSPKARSVFTISPPKSKLSDVMEIRRRETFTVKSLHVVQEPHIFAIPKAPRDIINRPIGSIISQSLTSLSSSVTSLASTHSMPATNGKLYNENFINAYKHRDPFSAATTEDPFLSSTMYLDEQTLDGIEKSFKKWLNALVTLPEDIESSSNQKIDVAKLFNDVQTKDLVLAPTKEIVCSRYYTARLDSLRSAAIRLFHSDEISKPLNKLAVIINEKKLLEVHSARNIHLDIVLQRSLLELLLCFNPLWLRIGLEIVFNVQLNLNSNQDIFGMSKFIINNMFKSPYLQQKYGKFNQREELLDKLKKHTAKNFLFILFFLDRAKELRLIKQNPCLFLKSAPYKDSNEILKKFASLVLANYGDIIRMMKRIDYVLTHKQTVIDEFDYAFKNLGVDLRDGVRLTKVMEVILLRDDLIKKVRVPAISRLQKVHNVDLALKALEEAEYSIMGNITAKDIADGHREKTLSLLWQIIYKFRAPRFNAAAKIIQTFWRRKLLKVIIERRIRRKHEEKMANAAVIIQKHFRGWKSRKSIREYRQKIITSCITIQKYTRGVIARNIRKKRYAAIVRIQKWYRNVIDARKERQHFLLQRKFAIKIQIWWKRQLLARKLIASSLIFGELRIQLNEKKSSSAKKIQEYWKGYKLMQEDRQKFLKYRECVINIQKRYRCKLIMIKVREEYIVKQKAVITIQTYWRSIKMMRKAKNEYQNALAKICFVQNRVRANQLMRRQQSAYKNMQLSAIKIQRFFRNYKETMRIRQNYINIQTAIITIQRRFRAQRCMKQTRADFLRKKNAATTLQKHFRGYMLMKQQQISFLELKHSAIVLQTRYRANLEMRKALNQYHIKRTAIVKIQIWRRSVLAMRREKILYRDTRKKIIWIQNRFRSNCLMRKCKEEYQLMRLSAVKIQKYYRAFVQMKKDQCDFLKMKSAAVIIQQRYRAQLKMREERREFLEKKTASLTIQKYWKGYLQMKKDQSYFIKYRQFVITIQKIYRGKLLTKTVRKEYEAKRNAIIKIQTYWGSVISMRKQKLEYKNTLAKIRYVQNKFRANRMMKIQHKQYNVMKSSATKIKIYFRSYLEMKKIRLHYINVQKSVLIIQQRFRAHQLMIKDKNEFMRKKSAAIAIQKYWRGHMLSKKERNRFIKIKLAVVKTQQRYRSKLEMKRIMQEYQNKQAAILKIQTFWRSVLLMRSERARYRLTLEKIRFIQTHFRANQLRDKQVEIFKRQKSSAIVIQRWFRSYKLMMSERSYFLSLKKSVKIIENRVIANKLMKRDRQKYLETKSKLITVQRLYRSKLETRKLQSQFQSIKRTALGLQTHTRGYQARLRFKEMQTPEKIEERRRHKAARTVQAAWRGFKERSKRSNQCFRVIVQRLMKASKNVDRSETLAVKLKISIDFLRYRYDSNVAISTLAKLEYMSRTVPWILIEDAQFLSAFCYGLMAQAIRSEVDKQIIELCSCIILNLARYKYTRGDAFQETGLITIAHMLLRWADKDCGIFQTLCTLVWVFSHCPERKAIIRNFMTMKDGEYIMYQIKQNVLRKENMRKNSRRPIGFRSISLIKYKKDYLMQLRHQPDTIYSSGFITPEMLKQCRQFPSLEADYGVVRMHPYIFYSSVFAFESVLKSLDIHNIK